MQEDKEKEPSTCAPVYFTAGGVSIIKIQMYQLYNYYYLEVTN